MSAPERTGNPEDPPRPHRSWAPRPKFASIIAALVTFISAVATVAQLMGYIRSNEINLLVSAVAIVSFAIGVVYLYSTKGGKVALTGTGIVLAPILVTFLIIELIPPSRSPSTLSCNKVASPDGSDANTGDLPDSPVKTVGQLAILLAPGQTGCLRAGIYTFNEVRLATERIRISSYPGEQATLVGYLVIGGPGSTVEKLKLDGSSSGAGETVNVMAPDVTIRDNEITNSKQGKGDNRAVCIRAKENSHRLTVEGNRIHDCGRHPSDNNGIAIQIRHASGAIIKNNFIYDNVDDAIQLYPAAQYSLIVNNTIDGNGAGVKFGGSDEYDATSSYNIVMDNIITNSILRWNIEDYWGLSGYEHIGVGNIVRSNCVLATNQEVYYNTNGGVKQGSFVAENNLVTDPQYVDRKGKDFRIAERSPCAGKGVSS